jgi:hypothetical protein
MTAENFAYWLQGFFEVSQADELTKEQVQEIKNHLKLVFNKVTPNVYDVGYVYAPNLNGVMIEDNSPHPTGVTYCMKTGQRVTPPFVTFGNTHASC